MKSIADDISTQSLRAHQIGRRLLAAPLADVAGLAVELRDCADTLKTCAVRAENERARDARETMGWGEGGPG